MILTFFKYIKLLFISSAKVLYNGQDRDQIAEYLSTVPMFRGQLICYHPKYLFSYHAYYFVLLGLFITAIWDKYQSSDAINSLLTHCKERLFISITPLSFDINFCHIFNGVSFRRAIVHRRICDQQAMLCG